MNVIYDKYCNILRQSGLNTALARARVPVDDICENFESPEQQLSKETNPNKQEKKREPSTVYR